MPLTAATVETAVDTNAPPTGFVEIDIVTNADDVVTRVLLASRICTWSAGVNSAVAVTVVGCVTNASWLGGPNTLNGWLVTLVRAPPDCTLAVTVKPVPL